MKNSPYAGMNVINATPFHKIPESEKTDEWKEWVVEFYDNIGWSQVLKNHKKIIKNRRLVAGELDPEDYISNVDENELANLIGIIGAPTPHDPLKQFFPIIPSIMSILSGEALQKDNRVIIKAVDEFSANEALEFKDNLFREVLQKKALSDRDAALRRMGVIPSESDPETTDKYNQEMETARALAEVETKFKNFRTEAEKWGQHVNAINRVAQNMEVKEQDGFIESLTNSKVYYHIDMGEESFKTKLIDNAYAFYHVSEEFKFAGEGDYFGWFEFASLGDILNTLGTHPDMTEEKINQLHESMTLNSIGNILTTNDRDKPGAFYDHTKPYPLGGNVNRNLQETITQYNVEQSFKGDSVSLVNKYMKKNLGDPHMYKITNVYVRSFKKMGWCTIVNRAGQVTFQDWVDENFKVTVEPVYDTSVVKNKSAQNLLYGEHVEWTWVNQWRRFIKIGNNLDHSFWRQKGTMKPIYLDGNPCKFQFKGKDPYECQPPIVGCEFRTQGTRPVSFVDRTKTFQILANIAGNKIPHALSKDLGIGLAINKQMIPRDNADDQYDGDPLDRYIDQIRDTGVIPYSTTKEQMETSTGQAIAPQMVNLSTVNEAIMSLDLYQRLREECFETVGISRQRRAQSKPYENQANIQSGIEFSETQTLPYFHQFFNVLVPQLYQKQLEASQYYASKSKVASAYYMNSKEQNAYIEVAGTDILHRHLHIYATSSPKVKDIEKQLKGLLMSDNTIPILDRAQGLVAETNTEFIETIKENQDKLQKQEQERFEQEQETLRQQNEAIMQKSREEINFKLEFQRRELESEERIAAMQITGAVGADDSLPDPSAAIGNALKAQQIQTQADQAQNKMTMDQQNNIQKTLTDRYKIATDLKKSQIDLEIAKENRTKAEMGKSKK